MTKREEALSAYVAVLYTDPTLRRLLDGAKDAGAAFSVVMKCIKEDAAAVLVPIGKSFVAGIVSDLGESFARAIREGGGRRR